MNASKQHFSVVLFIMQDKVILTFESVDEIIVTIQIKAIEQCFPLRRAKMNIIEIEGNF